jgi:hypothetical protein
MRLPVMLLFHWQVLRDPVDQALQQGFSRQIWWRIQQHGRLTSLGDTIKVTAAAARRP